MKSTFFLLTLFLTAQAMGQHQHDHHQVTEEVKKLLKFTEKRPELRPELCPDPKDRAFVNYHANQLKDPEGFHGMLFFGTKDTFYISHLPMFHKPHNYQAILEVRLKPEAKAKYLARLKEKGGYFTFSPAGEFVLPQMVVGKQGFGGTLVQGHFERGGLNSSTPISRSCEPYFISRSTMVIKSRRKSVM